MNRYPNTTVSPISGKSAWLYCLVLMMIFQACETTEEQNEFSLDIPTESAIIGIATPIQLRGEMTEVILDDYFNDPLKIDSIGASSEKIKHTFYADEKRLEISKNGTPEYLSNLTLRADGYNYDFLVKKSLRQTVRVEYEVPEGKNVKKVQLVGDLNNWNPNNSPMTQEGNTWYADLSLNPGRYPYKIVVDGAWILDPANPEKISNNIGGYNSLLEVKKPDLNTIPFLYTKQFDNQNITIGFTLKPTQVLAYWENYKLPVEINESGMSVPIPNNSESMKRSFIRVYAYNENGLSNDLKIPLEYGKPLSDTKDIQRMDKEAMMMYFPLVDRFNNGDKSNDEPLDDDRLEPIQNYMGGDLKGITQKIKDGYFKEMGMNTLWLSPITQNPLEAYQEYPEPKRYYSGYHGYWPISSSKVDHRFGDDETMHELVRTAHENDMNVLLDYVCNHVHILHPIYQNNPEWVTAVDLPDGTKNIRIWEEQRLTTWFDMHIPTLDLSNPEVIEVQADSAFYWLKKFNLDGYRHDATKHIPEEFWRFLTKKIKKEIIAEEGRDIYQIGETYGSHELISSYISSGMVESQFDFNIHFTARDVFAKDDASLLNISNAMRETFDYYGYHSTMGNISGNHDQTRFMGLASGAVAFDEDAKEAGFARKIEVKDKKGYQKLANMHAFLMSVPGVPVIYYGDEIGMVGASDPDNRRMMRFDDLAEEETALREKVKELTQARKNSLALIYGDTYMLRTEKDVMAYARVYFDEVAIIIFNKNGEAPIDLELPEFLLNRKLKSKLGNSDISLTGNKLRIKIPKGSYDYIMN